MNEKYLEKYWALEQEKTELAASVGLTVPWFIFHRSRLHPAVVKKMEGLLREQIKTLKLMRVKDVVENVVFVQFRRN